MHNNGSSAHFDWQGNSIFDEWIVSRDYAPSSGRLHFAMQEWMVVAWLDVHYIGSGIAEPPLTRSLLLYLMCFAVVGVLNYCYVVVEWQIE